jgi:hypothetical protein
MLECFIENSKNGREILIIIATSVLATEFHEKLGPKTNTQFVPGAKASGPWLLFYAYSARVVERLKENEK